MSSWDQAAPVTEVKPEPVIVAPEVEPVMASVPVEQAPTIPEISPQEPRRATIRSSRAKEPSRLDQTFLDRMAAKTKKAKDRAEKAKLARQQTKAAAAALVVPAPPAPLVNTGQFLPGKSGNPAGRPRKVVKDAIEKVIANARALNSKDPLVATRLEALMYRVYDKAMEPEADLEEILEAAKFIADRLDGKPSNDDTGMISSGGGPLVVNIGTRFTPTLPKADILEAEVLESH